MDTISCIGGPLTLKETMQKLSSLGTERNRLIYSRYGMTGELFGVSFGDLKTLTKQIKVDHALALELWETGNHDARHLATQIADPKTMTEKQIDSWVKGLGDYVACDFLAELVAKTPFAGAKTKEWIASKDEWVGRSGWNLVARRAMDDPSLTDSELEKLLTTIEKTIHGSKNFTRHAMNMALIAIGIRNDSLEKKAVAAAKRIGKVEVDHGQTACVTPDAVAYIAKTRAHYAKKEKVGSKAKQK